MFSACLKLICLAIILLWRYILCFSFICKTQRAAMERLSMTRDYVREERKAHRGKSSPGILYNLGLMWWKTTDAGKKVSISFVLSVISLVLHATFSPIPIEIKCLNCYSCENVKNNKNIQFCRWYVDLLLYSWLSVTIVTTFVSLVNVTKLLWLHLVFTWWPWHNIYAIRCQHNCWSLIWQVLKH